MLELTKSSRTWRWTASGKHPSVKDYINIGQGFPLADSFSDWLNKGYQAQRFLSSSAHSNCSWRFWVKGTSKNEISCGLVKDSSDSIGRPYPLLIMGNGPLEGWEDTWGLVPEVCETTWIQMETLSTKAFIDLKELAQHLASLPQPLPHGSPSLAAGDVDLEEHEVLSSSDVKLFSAQLRMLSGKNVGYIVLDQFNDYGRINNVQFVGRILSRHLVSAPSTVFIGGTQEMSCYAFFRRPLTVSDFSTLWTHLSQRVQVGEK